MKRVSRRMALMGAGALAAAYGAGQMIFSGNRERPRAMLKKTKGRRPNILLIVTDQERARHLLPANLARPHHERLAAKSTTFRNAAAVSNLCSMARGVIYSGLHPQHNGVWENTPLPYADAFRTDIPTLGTMMQDAGYRTAYFGKWHLTHTGVGDVTGREAMAEMFRSFGFDHTDQDADRDGALNGWLYDPVSAKSAAKFFHEMKDEEEPWFTAVNFVNPHDIMFFKTSEHQEETRLVRFPDDIKPAPDDPLYAKDWGVPLPETFGDATLEGKPKAQREMQLIMKLVLGDIPLERRDLWAAYNNYYFNCLCDMDRALGTVLDALDETGQSEDTIVIYMADHGEMAGVHGLREKGGNLYRENQNIPLLIRHPDVPGGRETEALASQLDIAPTILGLAGVDAQARAEAYPLLKGHDLSPALTAPGTGLDAGPRQAALFQWTSLVHMSVKAMQNMTAVQSAKGALAKLEAFDSEDFMQSFRSRGHMRGLTDGRYKFARYFSPLEHHQPKSWEDLMARNDLELYDTHEDPMEKINLAADPEAHRPLIESLNARLNRLIEEEIGEDNGSHLPGPSALWQAG